MEYKIHVSGYLEDSHQLLVSFSCEDTKHEARDYQSFSFDIAPYGDISVEDVLKEIAKQAPILCEEIIMYETIKNKDEKAEGFRALIGQEFTYNNKDLFVVDEADRLKNSAPEATESETI
jgi:hypothetical protein|tara:strand:+ start:2679 stop:3038 length:360 start_codon:yes stop_codon:yes gene_type:complete